jgi:hypothetical protein
MRACLMVLLSFMVAMFTTTLSVGQPAKVQANTDRKQSCRKFVQSFYDGYAPVSGSTLHPPPDMPRGWEAALRARPQLFDSELARRLMADYIAQQKSPKMIVGLDGDPFIGGNAGFVGAYIAGKVTETAGRCFVAVHAQSTRHPDFKADIEPELALRHGRWQFVNFRDSQSREDLLTALKRLETQRQQQR